MEPRNEYERKARAIKANALADHLERQGVSHRDFPHMDASLRAHHAVLAGVRDPSDDTWEMVGQALNTRASVRERYAADPFEGL